MGRVRRRGCAGRWRHLLAHWFVVVNGTRVRVIAEPGRGWRDDAGPDRYGLGGRAGSRVAGRSRRRPDRTRYVP